MNPFEKLPPWKQPVIYNDAPDLGPAINPATEETFVRRGPHDEEFGLDDEDDSDTEDYERGADDDAPGR